MGQRGIIGIKEKNKIKAVYVHWLDKNDLNLLNEYYNTEEKAKELIELGALSYIGEKIAPRKNEVHKIGNSQPDVTLAYHRDRGDALDIKIFKNKKEIKENAEKDDWTERLFLYNGKEWVSVVEKY